jgi:hypothetical protein
MNRLLVIVLVLLNISVHAQTSKKQNIATVQNFANTITTTDLKKHLYIIAGKEMEGRENASVGQRKAAAYIEKEFRRIGLKPGFNGSYQQPYPVFQDSLIKGGLEVNGKKFLLNKDFTVNSNNFNALQSFSEGVYISSSVPADSIAPGSLAGKLVIIAGERRTMRGTTQTGRLKALRNAGPAAILYIDTSPELGVPSGKEQYLSVYKKYILPQQFTITESIAKKIIKNYENLSSLSSINTFQGNFMLQVEKKSRQLMSSNVIGILPGTDKTDEYLFITAHYDHLGKRDTVIYYGADDDGSGTVSVLEIAEAWAKAKASGKGPRRTIVFMTVSGEEKGLLGSEYYTMHPVFPLEKTTADLNIDMVGRSDNRRTTGDSTNYVYIVGDDKISTELKTLNEAQNKKYTKLELDYKYNDPEDRERIYFRSDHYNFAKTGVPIIFYTDGMLNPDYHKPGDTPDKINYALLQKRAHFVFYMSWGLANRDNMLVRDLPIPVSQR